MDKQKPIEFHDVASARNKSGFKVLALAHCMILDLHLTLAVPRNSIGFSYGHVSVWSYHRWQHKNLHNVSTVDPHISGLLWRTAGPDSKKAGYAGGRLTSLLPSYYCNNHSRLTVIYMIKRLQNILNSSVVYNN